jgi:tetratricopeptide (TPR) repeat protein
MPLFFLPFSFEQFEFNKQYLLCLLVAIGFLAWLAKMILADKEIKIKKTPLDIAILIFLGIAILSTLFSIDRYASLMGFYGRFSDGLIGLISLILFYFLITNNVGKNESTQPESIINLLLSSGSIVVLASYFSIFGIWPKINNALLAVNSALSLPKMMLAKGFNPISKSLEGLAIFLAIFLVILIVKTIVLDTKVSAPQKKNAKRISIFNNLLWIGALGLMLVIDFTGAWIVLAISLSLFLTFALRTRLFKDDTRKLLLPLFLIIIAGFFAIIDPIKTNLAKEQILDQGNSWAIAGNTLTDNAKNLFLGSGPGTFFHSFAKEKSVNLNSAQLWQLRYDRAGNYISELLTTAGLLGFLGYVLILGIIIMLVGLASNISQLPILIILVSIIIAQLTYYQNSILGFMFWLILGLLAANWKKEIKLFSFKDFAELSLIFNAVLICLSLLMVFGFYLGAKSYYADIAYAKSENTTDSIEKRKLLEKAIQFSPQTVYYRAMVNRVYLNEITGQIGQSLSQEESVFFQQKVAKTIDNAKKASEIAPNNIIAWENLAMVYREIRTVAEGALEWGTKAFEKSLKLDPTNPVLHTELGKLYLAASNNDQARQEFEKAIELKPDYVDAYLQKSLLDEKESKNEEAIKSLKELADLYPLNVEVLFQLGRLYYNNKQVADAIVVLERVVRLSPSHSNALYSLAIAYDAQGEKKEAIDALQKVLDLNPDNVALKEKMEEWKK